jgi:hypothetical protein
MTAIILHDLYSEIKDDAIYFLADKSNGKENTVYVLEMS